MLVHLLAACLAVAPGDVSVQPLNGPAVKGSLVSLSSESVVLNSADGEQTFASRELLSVAPELRPDVPKELGGVQIDLVDGSRLATAGYEVASRKAQIELVGGQKIDAPTSAIHSVRFRKQEGGLVKQWADIEAAEATGDVLVIRKVSIVKSDDGEKETEREVVALDSLEGVIFNVTPEIVQFQFDGELIPVKREKIEGMIYFHPAGGRSADPVCRLTEAGGSAWMVKSVALGDGKLSFESIAGVKSVVSFDSVVNLDYSAGKIVYLSDIDPINVEWTSDIPLAKPLESERKMYLPRRDRGFVKGSKLRLQSIDDNGNLIDREYDKGLAIHSRTLIEFNLPGEYQHFLAEVGIDSSVPQKWAGMCVS